MKMKVVSTMKGKLTIPYVYGSYKAGEEVSLTKDQVESSDIQNLLNIGLIEFVDKKDKKAEESLISYKNLTKSILSFSWGSTIRPSQTFFLSNKNAESTEVEQLVKAGKMCKSLKSDKETDKKIKKVSEKQPYIVNPNKEKTEKIVSKDVHIHVPKNIKESSLFEDSEELEFVDIKQAKERLAKTKKSLQDKNG